MNNVTYRGNGAFGITLNGVHKTYTPKLPMSIVPVYESIELSSAYLNKHIRTYGSNDILLELNDISTTTGDLIIVTKGGTGNVNIYGANIIRKNENNINIAYIKHIGGGMWIMWGSFDLNSITIMPPAQMSIDVTNIQGLALKTLNVCSIITDETANDGIVMMNTIGSQDVFRYIIKSGVIQQTPLRIPSIISNSHTYGLLIRGINNTLYYFSMRSGDKLFCHVSLDLGMTWGPPLLINAFTWARISGPWEDYIGAIRNINNSIEVYAGSVFVENTPGSGNFISATPDTFPGRVSGSIITNIPNRYIVVYMSGLDLYISYSTNKNSLYIGNTWNTNIISRNIFTSNPAMVTAKESNGAIYITTYSHASPFMYQISKYVVDSAPGTYITCIFKEQNITPSTPIMSYLDSALVGNYYYSTGIGANNINNREIYVYRIDITTNPHEVTKCIIDHLFPSATNHTFCDMFVHGNKISMSVSQYNAPNYYYNNDITKLTYIPIVGLSCN